MTRRKENGSKLELARQRVTTVLNHGHGEINWSIGWMGGGRKSAKKKHEANRRVKSEKEKKRKGKEQSEKKKSETGKTTRGEAYRGGFRYNEFHPQWVITGLARLPVSPSRPRWEGSRVALVRGPGIALRSLYVAWMIPYKVAGTAADAGGVVMF